jgi:CheY-like chemotaxis protein
MMHILYIEDDPASVRVIKKVAKHLGHSLIVAATALEALNLIQSDLDLILTDISLPDMVGLDLIKHIRTLHPKVTLIAITAHAMPADRAKCLNAGCSEYLSKPFDFPEIAALLERYSH